MIEKELKYKLSKRHYQKILRLFKKFATHRYVQENFYFDHPRLKLRRKKYMLRVRDVKNGSHYLTLKYPKKSTRALSPGLKVRVEHEVKIPSKIALQVISGKRMIKDLTLKPIRILKKKFSKRDLEKIQPLGKLTTYRTIVPLKKWLVLEIDESKVFQKKFYELEVETPNPEKADRYIQELFERWEIPFEHSDQSKFSRFLQESQRFTK